MSTSFENFDFFSDKNLKVTSNKQVNQNNSVNKSQNPVSFKDMFKEINKLPPLISPNS